MCVSDGGHVIITEAQVDCEPGRESNIILHENACVVRAEVVQSNCAVDRDCHRCANKEITKGQVIDAGRRRSVKLRSERIRENQRAACAERLRIVVFLVFDVGPKPETMPAAVDDESVTDCD
jgi:hypothetical protein